MFYFFLGPILMLGKLSASVLPPSLSRATMYARCWLSPLPSDTLMLVGEHTLPTSLHGTANNGHKQAGVNTQ